MALQNNLFDQTDEVTRDAMASCLGFDGVGAGFRNFLREIPAIEDFTVGKALDAYLMFMLQRQLLIARMPEQAS